MKIITIDSVGTSDYLQARAAGWTESVWVQFPPGGTDVAAVVSVWRHTVGWTHLVSYHAARVEDVTSEEIAEWALGLIGLK